MILALKEHPNYEPNGFNYYKAVKRAEQEKILKQLRKERNAVGFSESFLSRRRFPIKHDESETERADQIPSPQPDFSPRARFAE